MSDPFPSGGYGVANWQDYQNNWRKADTDWVQSRSILRYQAGPPASGEIGQTVYDFAADKLMLRSKDSKWIPVAAAENLAVSPITSASPTEGVGLSHKSAGQGLVFAPTEIIAYQKFRTGASEVVLDPTGVTVKTGAATALLNTDATNLASSIPITAPGLISSTTLSVAGLSTLLDVNARDASFSRNVSVTGTLGVTGLLTASGVDIAAAPSSPTRAANKAYVDAQAALQLTPSEGDARYVNNTGDTMTGVLTMSGGWINILPGQDTCLRLNAVTPLLEWRNASGSVRYGYINATAANLNIISDAGDVKINSGGGQVRCSDSVYADNQIRAYAPSQQMICIGADPYLGFYNGTSVDSYGTRAGYIGFTSDNYMHITNEQANSSTFYNTGYAHVFQIGGGLSIQIFSGVTTVGKNTGDISYIGHALYETGTQYITRGNDGTGILYLNRIGSPPSGRPYQYFCRNDGGIGAIYQNGTSGVSYATSSDYRQKNIVGPITDAIERIKRLKPYRVTWKDDPERGETDAFIAHELAEVVPDAVTGEKDGQNDDPAMGTGPAYQQVDYSNPVTLLAAGLQNIIARVEELESAAAPAA